MLRKANLNRVLSSELICVWHELHCDELHCDEPEYRETIFLQYRSQWEKHGIPGEQRHYALRWYIRSLLCKRDIPQYVLTVQNLEFRQNINSRLHLVDRTTLLPQERRPEWRP